MLNNYSESKPGIIHQNVSKAFNYSSEYIHGFDKLPCERMSEIRFDNIFQSLGKLPGSILDVGYGNGSFLLYCKEERVKGIYGYDISPVNPPMDIKRIASFDELKYVDVITFFDSLEHCYNIDDVIHSLPEHKYIVITVPCCRDINYGYTDEWFASYKHLKPDEHLFHFTTIGLLQFMIEKGYALVSLNSCEDTIRKPVDQYPNTITGIFRKL